MNDAVTLLPLAGVDRWRPTRAGLVNLWRYWDETFTFHHGRLLLRGPNGSGKSMALELLLPFLLDADSNPSRLTSAAKSRGGLYERVMTGTVDSGRAGFAWVELRRGEQVFTVGVRMRASTSTHKVDLDFFTTSLEVGAELHLLDEHRSVLSRKGLVEALGDRGRVHSSAEEHRAAVRETLFPGFGADRYASVITALLALRKEKLSQNLDLAKLSEVLSEALPALDEHDLAVVAEGFERLDRRRSELAKLEAELVEVRALAARQRDYARVVAAGVAGQVRRAETRRDDVTKAERSALVALEAARTEAEAVEVEVAALVERLAALDTEIDALKASDAYRDGATLDDLRDSARRARDALDRDERVAAHRAEERERQVAAAEELAGERGRAAANLELAAADLRRSAAPVGAEGVAGEAEAAGAEEGERLVRAWVRARRQLVEEMRKALRAHESAVQQRVFAESRVAGDEAVVDERLASRRAAAAAHAGAVTAYVEAVGSWATSCTAVGTERVRAAIPQRPEDPAGVAAGVGRLAAELQAEHAVTRANLGTDRAAVEDELGRLLAERDSLAEGGIVEPAPPAWRSDRAVRAGAPLWRLVDVAEGVEPTDVDGLEAAMAASGLLDAWVAPDGSVDLPDGTADVVLGRRPVEGRSAADLLVAQDEVAAGVLASIAVGDTAAGGPEVVVGTDGTFRLGPAAGRGLLRPAELLGAAAQERHRLARLAEVEATIAATEARRAEIDRELAAVDAREAAALADLDAAPAGGQVTEAARQAELAEARLVEAESRLAASRRALGDAEENVRRALRTLATLGARHQLPTTAEAIEEVVGALAALETAIGTWARRARELAGAERHLRRARADAERAADAAAEAAANVAASQRAAAEVEVKLATLESSIGAGYRELLDRIAGLDGERRHGRDRQRQLSERRPEMQRRIGKLETELAQAETARIHADGERASAHRRFVALASDGVAADTGLPAAPAGDLEGVTAVLAAARALAAELEGVVADDQAVERASARVEERLHHARAALGSSVDLSRTLADEGWWLLRATAGGLRRPMREQALALAVDLEEGRAELAAEEERLFEQTLAGSVRHALADRIRLANQLVDGINRQLGAVRSAAGGVQVRLRWEVDSEQPKAVKEARALLLRDPASLSDDERASLQAFVRARVDQARAELEVNAPWEARLRETLDYRAWHRFTLQLAHRDWAGFEPATARRLQRLSTGERSVALHLPMLASIAAHYSDADGKPAGCPRLILLDELFAGVDSVNRAQLFGTFTAWDLDAVFTSDHEWCQYASLDGIAIHHLHPAVGDEPVTSTRFTWDGRRRELDPTAA
jgi:uncharacterized protein (TIGR02680 family)